MGRGSKLLRQQRHTIKALGSSQGNHHGGLSRVGNDVSRAESRRGAVVAQIVQDTVASIFHLRSGAGRGGGRSALFPHEVLQIFSRDSKYIHVLFKSAEA